MAASRICSIDDCGKPHYGRGWCHKHYNRWYQRGDPLSPDRITARGEPERYFRDVVLNYDGRECLIWPYGRDADGYATATIDGKRQSVSRAVCERMNGLAPSKHDAAHSCGRGTSGCVTKGHLSWKTRKENVADTLIHGTRNRGTRQGNSKLTEPEVRQIRALLGTISQRKIGRMFGVSHATVGEIKNETIWGWLV